MPHAERSSTSVPRLRQPAPPSRRRHIVALLVLIPAAVVTSAVVGAARPASADQISNDRAQASAITAQIQATQVQIQSLTGQVNAADYQLSQLQAQIGTDQAAVAKDQAAVGKDRDELRTEAIADYTDSGSGSQVTDLFSSNLNTNGIRSEYTSIATGNVTTTVDRLHTAQGQLQATQAALQKQSAAGRRHT